MAHRSGPPRAGRPERRGQIGLLATGVLLAVALAFGLPWRLIPSTGPRPSPTPGTSSGAPAPTATSSAAPSAIGISPEPTPTALAPGPVPIVPVADFRTTITSIGPAQLRAVVVGTSPTWTRLELVGDQADAILTAIGQTRSSAGSRLLTSRNAAAVMADLAAHRDRLAFLRADEVGPGVRALDWNGTGLFGVHRVKTMGDWRLDASLPGALEPYDPSSTWTLFAAGDLGLDRTYAYVVKNLHKGVDYPFAGGTARIAGLTCCSSFGWKVPTIVSTGHPGAMRDLISSADLALANMEESAPTRFTYHPSGTSFTGDPALIAGIARAGIDVASCASTHIGDGGSAGILQTMSSLRRYGIVPFGAGKNLAAARQPAIFNEGGVKVAIVGYDGISGKYYGATATTIGDTPLNPAFFKADAAAARAAGATVVIAFPHWGIEYTGGPSALQQRLGHEMIDAGFDIVIGNHPHWAQAMEVYKGKPIWYSLGNFTFDQGWSEPTLEGITLELTFRGATLVQAWINPHILIDAVQPNLLDLAGDGQRVLQPIYRASGKLLPW